MTTDERRHWLSIFYTAIIVLALPMEVFAGSGSGWQVTFEQDSLDTQLEMGPLSYILACAGDISCEDAIKVLKNTMSASAKVKLVMDAAALGDIRTLADKDIVKKSASLPVDRVMIVRVFSGSSITAVVTIYDKNGNNHGAFTGVKGRIMSKDEKKTSGVTEAAANTVGSIIKDTEEISAEQKNKYEEKVITLDSVTAIYANPNGVWASSWQEPRLGKYKKPITWPEFFKLVGHDEYARQFEKAENYRPFRILGYISAYGGITTLVLGGTFLAISLMDTSSDINDKIGKPAWIVTGCGAGLGIIGILLLKLGPDYPEVKSYQIRKMTDEYNTKLKRDIGIDTSEVKKSNFEIFVAPVVMPGYSGLSMAFRF